LDNDDGDSTRSNFISISGGEIGFFLTLADDLVDFFGIDFNTVFTQASLNPAGEDMAAAFPLLDNPRFLLGFATINSFSADGNTLLLGVNVVVNVVGVPEPSTFVLLLGDLLPLLLLGRRRRVLGQVRTAVS
jgi:hypothetical protein